MTVVPDLLRRRATEAPDEVALIADGVGSLTYRQWEQRSNSAARGLVSRGVATQQAVALIFGNRDWLDYAVGYVAVQKAGGIAVPLGPRFAGAELEGILAASGAVAVVSAGGSPGPGTGPGFAERLGPGVAHLSLPDLEDRNSPESFQVPVADSDLAEVLYTSGTTGLPKGVACSHANIAFHAPPPEGEVPGRASVVHAFPVGTNAGQEVLRLPLRRGDRTAVILAAFDPERYCQVIEERRVRRLQLVPAMAQLIVASGAAGRHDLSSVERVVLSSAPCPPTLIAATAAAFAHAAVWNTYALTEAGTARTLNTDAVAHPDTVGRPVGATELRIVDDEGNEVATGVAGEVLLRHPGAPARWYFRDPEATARTFDRQGWVHTGDIGYVDEGGTLFLVDRKKDLIIVGGLNVSSVEVENVLFRHPAVADVAVFGVDHPILGQDVAAAVVSRGAVTPAELQTFARRYVGEHEVPHRIVFVDTLPRTASGKVRKGDLREAFGPPPQARFAAPRTPEEAAVLGIWRQVLGRDDIGVEDDFFELGGHSLAAAQIVNRVEESLGVAIPVVAVFESSTPAAMAVAVESARTDEGDTGRPGGDATATAR